MDDNFTELAVSGTKRENYNKINKKERKNKNERR